MTRGGGANSAQHRKGRTKNFSTVTSLGVRLKQSCLSIASFKDDNKNRKLLLLTIIWLYLQNIFFWIFATKEVLVRVLQKTDTNLFICNSFFHKLDLLSKSELIYRGLTRRWSFILFPKSFQNLSQNCKFLFCLYFSVSQKSKIKNARSYFLKCMFWS